jgi:hypothetical protein
MMPSAFIWENLRLQSGKTPFGKKFHAFCVEIPRKKPCFPPFFRRSQRCMSAPFC